MALINTNEKVHVIKKGIKTANFLLKAIFHVGL